MRRSLMIVARMSLFVGVLCLPGCRCDPPPFDSNQAVDAQISVIHRPLHPAPGAAIDLIARTRNGPANITISFVAPDVSLIEHTCPATDTCVLNVPAGVPAVSMAVYTARAETTGGETLYPPSAYSFQVGTPATPPGARGALVALRIPFQIKAPDPFRIAFVRDRISYNQPAATTEMLSDTEQFLYSQILEDPAYRWRDNQLAFYYYTYPGVTTDYYSGLASRCGQAPWPIGGSGGNFPYYTPTEILFADVIAVIHKNDSFRDCAGLGVQIDGASPSRRVMAHGKRPTVVQHELGHALFGLGDEYNEGEDTRAAPAGEPPPFGTNCTCCDTDPIGGTNGGFCPPLSVPCAGFEPDPACFPVAAACPTIDSKCIKSEVYDTHDNIFDSETLCRAAADAINAHPGVELTANAVDCRPICGSAPGQTPCPCVNGASIERWKLDRRNPTGSGGDIMENASPYTTLTYNGPACEHCMETTFCMLWELGRGESQEAAYAQCYP